MKTSRVSVFCGAVLAAACAYGWGGGHNDVAKLCADYMPAEPKALDFITWGFRNGNWLHGHTGRVVSFAVLKKAFATDNPKLAAFCISVLSHAVSDQGALNHPPILQFGTYSKFKGIDYGWKNDAEFTLKDKVVAQGVRKRLDAYRPQVLGKSFDESAYEMVMDCYRQSEVAAETETAVAFGTKAEHAAAMTRVVAVQMEAMMD